MTETFGGNFTQQSPIDEEAIEAGVRVLRSGRLHRYNLAPGEIGEVGLLEEEFAAYIGSNYCLAVASGGYAIATALRAVGVVPGERVLTNAFTLAPVPGAIASVGAVPVMLGVTQDLTLDLADFERAALTGAFRTLLLSHMRGHICDMDRLMEIAECHNIRVVEDCAHTMGASWKGVKSGRHGVVACYSTQTYKHINSGEGGLLTTDDPEVAARSILLSGSYMLYERHSAAPDASVFEGLKFETPNISGRMDHLRAAILRPQLADIDRACAAWNARYRVVEDGLRGVAGLSVIERANSENYVGSSIQFQLMDWAADKISAVVSGCLDRGVELKWFGAPEPKGFTSTHQHWHYAESREIPETDRILAGLMDMRLPLTFSLEDCALIARIIADEVRRVSKL